MINHLSELININNSLILNVCLSTSQVNLLVAELDGARGGRWGEVPGVQMMGVES